MTQNTFSFTEFRSACPFCQSPLDNRQKYAGASHCRNCRVYVLNPSPPQAEIQRSYDTGNTFSTWQNELGIREVLWKKRLDLLLQEAPSGHLLDVGTGDGFFLDYARKHYEITSTEISADGRRYAYLRGHDPIPGDFSELILPAQSFDVVTMWHTLEHFPEPGDALRKVYTLLKPGGLLAVAVPNETRWIVKGALRNLFSAPPRAHPFPKLIWGGEVHLTFFRPASFKQTVRQAGFVLCSFGVDDVELHPTRESRIQFKINRLCAALTGWHPGKAMLLLARKPQEVKNQFKKQNPLGLQIQKRQG